MIHSFTPSGVEHLLDLRRTEVLGPVIHSFTPSGVEHLVRYVEPAAIVEVIHSFTPSGVEHDFCPTALAENPPGDSFVYAVRR